MVGWATLRSLWLRAVVAGAVDRLRIATGRKGIIVTITRMRRRRLQWLVIVKTVDAHLIEILDDHFVYNAVVPHKRLSVPGHLGTLGTMVDQALSVGHVITHPILEVGVRQVAQQQLSPLEGALAQWTQLSVTSHLVFLED